MQRKTLFTKSGYLSKPSGLPSGGYFYTLGDRPVRFKEKNIWNEEYIGNMVALK